MSGTIVGYESQYDNDKGCYGDGTGNNGGLYHPVSHDSFLYLSLLQLIFYFLLEMEMDK